MSERVGRATEGPIHGVLLAGGHGRRLGGDRPKALAMLEGETLLDRALATLHRVCDGVTIVAPADVALPERANATRVHDAAEGPLAALAAVFKAALPERVAVLGVDFPLMRVEAVAAMLALLGEGPAVVPQPGGRLQPLAAAYGPAGVRALIEAHAQGERSVSRAIESFRPRVLGDDDLARLPGGLDNFLNVNLPADLEDAARRLRARAVNA